MSRKFVITFLAVMLVLGAVSATMGGFSIGGGGCSGFKMKWC